jgi:hypothetical protein
MKDVYFYGHSVYFTVKFDLFYGHLVYIVVI